MQQKPKRDYHSGYYCPDNHTSIGSIMIGNNLFQIALDRLGWGDPVNGLWFIGPEEGESYSEGFLRNYSGLPFQTAKDVTPRSFPVATRTARLICELIDYPHVESYRDEIMWREGSAVFNGNFYPLGKRELKSWPDHYDELFGITRREYLDNRKLIENYRAERFQQLRREMEPQAIICFGKGQRPQFRSAFKEHNETGHDRANNVRVLPKNRLILTGHFSYGTWMTNKDIQTVAEILRSWDVSVPSDIGHVSR